MDNLLQILSAPLFVIIEVAILCGLLTKDMKVWNAEIERKVKEFKASSKTA